MFSAWQNKTLSIRIIAIVLTIAFIYQDIVWAQEGAPVWSKQVNAKWGQSPSGTVPILPNSNNNLNANIAIPRDIAATKEVFKGNNGDNKTIINIQDAHSSLGAQESISSILDSLVTNYDLKLVAIEGSSGYIDTSILKTFPDEKIRNNTARSLMAKGKMSAGEFYSVTSNKPIALYGIENKSLYRENVEEFRKVYQANQAVSKDIDNLLKTLNAIQDKLYSPELKALEANSVLKQNGSVSFTNRWSYVSELAKRVGIDIIHSGRGGLNLPYTNLSKLEESIKLEKQISFDTANKERDLLIDTLSKAITKTDLEKLVLKSLSFKQGKISQGEYYLFLQGLAKDYSIDPAPYKNLIKFTDYITLYESIDLLEIFEEAKVLEDAIKEKLYTSPDQKKLHDVIKCVNFIKNIFELKLTNQDFEYLDKNITICNKEAIAEFIHNCRGRLNVPYPVDNSENYDLDKIYENLPIALSFYKTAEKRNNAILENTIARMNKEGQTVAALITGGYHTKGISELLKAKETSYLVILPKFDASKGERPYVAILTNKSENYSEQLESGKYQLLTDDYFKGSIQDPGKVSAFIKDIIVTNLKQAKKEGKNVHNIAELWIESYRQNYEELKTAGIVKTEQAKVIHSSRAGLNLPYNVDNSGPLNDIGDQHIATTANFPQVEATTVTPEALAEAVRTQEHIISPPAFPYTQVTAAPGVEPSIKEQVGQLREEGSESKRIALSAVAQTIIDGVENRGQLPPEFSDDWLDGVLKAKPSYRNLSVGDQAVVNGMVKEAVMPLFAKATEASMVRPAAPITETPLTTGIEPETPQETLSDVDVWDRIWSAEGAAKPSDKEVLDTVALDNINARLVYNGFAQFLPQEGKILDVGCGSGRLGLQHALKNPEIEADGVDFSDQALYTAHRASELLGLSSRTHFVKSDIRHLPSDWDDSFDATFNEGVMEHFAPDQCRAILAEMVRVTKPGGKIVISVPNYFSPSQILLMALHRIDWRDVSKRDAFKRWAYGYEQPMKHSQLRAYFEELGLQDIEFSGWDPFFILRWGLSIWDAATGAWRPVWFAPYMQMLGVALDYLVVKPLDWLTGGAISRAFGVQIIIKGVKPQSPASVTLQGESKARGLLNPEKLRGSWDQFEYDIDEEGKVIRVIPGQLPSQKRLLAQRPRGHEYAFDLRLAAQKDKNAVEKLAELGSRIRSIIPDEIKLYVSRPESFHIAIAGRYPENKELDLSPRGLDDLIRRTIDKVKEKVEETGITEFTTVVSGIRITDNGTIVLDFTENPMLALLRGTVFEAMKTDWGENEVRVNRTPEGKPAAGGIITLGRIIPDLEGAGVFMDSEELQKLKEAVTKINDELKVNPISINFNAASFVRPTREFLYEGWDREDVIPFVTAAAPAQRQEGVNPLLLADSEEVLKQHFGIRDARNTEMLEGGVANMQYPPIAFETSDGRRLVLRRIHPFWNIEKLKFIVSVVNRLNEKGIPVAALYPRQGRPGLEALDYIAERGGIYYTLEEYMEGETVSVADAKEEHFREIGAMAASINNALIDFTPEGEKRYKLREVICTEVKGKLEQFQRELLKKPDSDAKALFSDNFNFFMEQAGIFETNYTEELRRNLVSCPIHNDLHAGNVKFDSNGKIVAVLDVEAAQTDSRILEFNNLIMGQDRIDAHAPYSRAKLEATVAAYQKTLNRKLNESELRGIIEILRLRFLEDMVFRFITPHPQFHANVFDYPEEIRHVEGSLRLFKNFVAEFDNPENIDNFVRENMVSQEIVPAAKTDYASAGQALIDFTSDSKRMAEFEAATEPVDLLMLLGNDDIGPAEEAARIVVAGKARHVMICGGYGRCTPGLISALYASHEYSLGFILSLKLLLFRILSSFLPTNILTGLVNEAALYERILIVNGVNPQMITKESSSTNTPENFKNGRRILEERGIPYKTMLIMQKPLQQLRVRATFENVFKDKIDSGEIAYFSHPGYIPNFASMDPDEQKATAKFLVDEFDKLKKYAAKGDIVNVAIPLEIEAALKQLAAAHAAKMTVADFGNITQIRKGDTAIPVMACNDHDKFADWVIHLRDEGAATPDTMIINIDRHPDAYSPSEPRHVGNWMRWLKEKAGWAGRMVWVKGVLGDQELESFRDEFYAKTDIFGSMDEFRDRIGGNKKAIVTIDYDAIAPIEERGLVERGFLPEDYVERRVAKIAEVLFDSGITPLAINFTYSDNPGGIEKYIIAALKDRVTKAFISEIERRGFAFEKTPLPARAPPSRPSLLNKIRNAVMPIALTAALFAVSANTALANYVPKWLKENPPTAAELEEAGQQLQQPVPNLILTPNQMPQILNVPEVPKEISQPAEKPEKTIWERLQMFFLGLFGAGAAGMMLAMGHKPEWQTEELNTKLDEGILAGIGPFEKPHFVIGDLHGVPPKRLKEVLRRINFINNAGHVIPGNKTLVIEGDIIDRGPESLKLIKYILDLQKEAARKGCGVVILLGNHEGMLYAGLKYNDDDQLRNWLLNLAQSGDELAMQLFSENAVLKRNMDEIRSRVLANAEWAELYECIRNGLESGAIQASYEKNGVLFVHGGVREEFASGRTAAEISEELNRDLRDGKMQEKSNLWNALWDKFAKNVTGKGVGLLQVVSHAPTYGTFAISEQKNVIDCDIGFSEVFGSSTGCLELSGEKIAAHTVKRSEDEIRASRRETDIATVDRRLRRIKGLISPHEYVPAGGLSIEDRCEMARFELQSLVEYTNELDGARIINPTGYKKLTDIITGLHEQLKKILKDAEDRYVRAEEIDAVAIADKLIGEGLDRSDVDNVASRIGMLPETINPYHRGNMSLVEEVVQDIIREQFGDGKSIRQDEYINLLATVAANMTRGKRPAGEKPQMMSRTGLVITMVSALAFFALSSLNLWLGCNNFTFCAAVLAASSAYLVMHGALLFFITKVLGIRAGPIASYVKNRKAIFYLTESRAGEMIMTRDENAAFISKLPRPIRFLIRIHEFTHAAGYGEIAALTLPILGFMHFRKEYRSTANRLVSETANKEQYRFHTAYIPYAKEFLIATIDREGISERIGGIADSELKPVFNRTRIYHTKDHNKHRINVRVFSYKVNTPEEAQKLSDAFGACDKNYGGEASIPNYTTIGYMGCLEYKRFPVELPAGADISKLRPEGALASRLDSVIDKMRKARKDMKGNEELEMVVMTTLEAVKDEFDQLKNKDTDGLIKVITEKCDEYEATIERNNEVITTNRKISAQMLDDMDRPKISKKERDSYRQGDVNARKKIVDAETINEDTNMFIDALHQLWFYVLYPERNYMEKERFRLITPLGKDLKNDDPIVLFANALTPIQIDYLAKKYAIAAIVTPNGTTTSHWVIYAKNRRIPVIITNLSPDRNPLEEARSQIEKLAGERESPQGILPKVALVTTTAGASGEIVLSPHLATVRHINAVAVREIALNKLALEEFYRPLHAGYTKYPIQTAINADSIEEVERVKKELGVDRIGVGLFRTEYLFTNENIFEEDKKLRENRPVIEYLNYFFETHDKPQAALPVEEAEDNPRTRLREYLKEYFIKLGEAAGGMVKIRTIDFEPDKRNLIHDALRDHGIKAPRGFAFYQTDIGREILLLQLEAIMEAGLKAKNLTLFFPMVSTRIEAEYIFGSGGILAEARGRLLVRIGADRSLSASEQAKCINRINRMPCGIMIETDAAIENINALADMSEIDFFSIGTNDLARFIMARALLQFDSEKKIIPLDRDKAVYREFLSHIQPEVLDAIVAVIKVLINKNKRMCICGEMASWYDFQVALVKKIEKLELARYKRKLLITLSMAGSRLPLAKLFMREIASADYKGVDTFLAEGRDKYGRTLVHDKANMVVSRIFDRIYHGKDMERIAAEIKSRPPEPKERTLYTIALLDESEGKIDRLPPMIRPVEEEETPPAVQAEEETVPPAAVEAAPPAAVTQVEAPASVEPAQIVSKTVRLKMVDPGGMHARPATAFATKIAQFKKRNVIAKIVKMKLEEEAQERIMPGPEQLLKPDVLWLMGIGIHERCEITVEATGLEPDVDEFLDKLAHLESINDNEEMIPVFEQMSAPQAAPGAVPETGTASLKIVADWFAKHGWSYSPFVHAPIVEEIGKVGIPLTVLSILNIFNNNMPILNIGIFAGLLTVLGIAFVLLHIFNERAPPKTKVEIHNLFRAPTRAAIDGGLIALFTLSFLTLPPLLFPLMAVVTARLAISRHRTINLSVLEYNAKERARINGISLEQARQEELRSPQGPLGYATAGKRKRDARKERERLERERERAQKESQRQNLFREIREGQVDSGMVRKQKLKALLQPVSAASAGTPAKDSAKDFQKQFSEAEKKREEEFMSFLPGHLSQVLGLSMQEAEEVWAALYYSTGQLSLTLQAIQSNADDKDAAVGYFVNDLSEDSEVNLHLPTAEERERFIEILADADPLLPQSPKFNLDLWVNHEYFNGIMWILYYQEEVTPEFIDEWIDTIIRPLKPDFDSAAIMEHMSGGHATAFSASRIIMAEVQLQVLLPLNVVVGEPEISGWEIECRIREAITDTVPFKFPYGYRVPVYAADRVTSHKKDFHGCLGMSSGIIISPLLADNFATTWQRARGYAGYVNFEEIDLKYPHLPKGESIFAWAYWNIYGRNPFPIAFRNAMEAMLAHEWTHVTTHRFLENRFNMQITMIGPFDRAAVLLRPGTGSDLRKEIEGSSADPDRQALLVMSISEIEAELNAIRYDEYSDDRSRLAILLDILRRTIMPGEAERLMSEKDKLVNAKLLSLLSRELTRTDKEPGHDMDKDQWIAYLSARMHDLDRFSRILKRAADAIFAREFVPFAERGLGPTAELSTGAGMILPSTRSMGEWLFSFVDSMRAREYLIGIFAGLWEFFSIFRPRSFLDAHRSAKDHISPQKPEERAQRKAGLTLIYGAMAAAVIGVVLFQLFGGTYSLNLTGFIRSLILAPSAANILTHSFYNVYALWRGRAALTSDYSSEENNPLSARVKRFMSGEPLLEESASCAGLAEIASWTADKVAAVFENFKAHMSEDEKSKFEELHDTLSGIIENSMILSDLFASGLSGEEHTRLRQIDFFIGSLFGCDLYIKDLQEYTIRVKNEELRAMLIALLPLGSGLVEHASIFIDEIGKTLGREAAAPPRIPAFGEVVRREATRAVLTDLSLLGGHKDSFILSQSPEDAIKAIIPLLASDKDFVRYNAQEAVNAIFYEAVSYQRGEFSNWLFILGIILNTREDGRSILSLSVRNASNGNAIVHTAALDTLTLILCARADDRPIFEAVANLSMDIGNGRIETPFSVIIKDMADTQFKLRAQDLFKRVLYKNGRQKSIDRLLLEYSRSSDPELQKAATAAMSLVSKTRDTGAGMIPVVRVFLRWAEKTPLRWIGLRERYQAFWEQVCFTALVHTFSLTGDFGGPIGAIFVSWSIFYAAHSIEAGGIRAPPAQSIFKIYAFNILGALAILPFDLSVILSNPLLIKTPVGVITILINLLEFLLITRIHHAGNIEYLESEKSKTADKPLVTPGSPAEEKISDRPFSPESARAKLMGLLAEANKYYQEGALRLDKIRDTGRIDPIKLLEAIIDFKKSASIYAEVIRVYGNVPQTSEAPLEIGLALSDVEDFANRVADKDERKLCLDRLAEARAYLDKCFSSTIEPRRGSAQLAVMAVIAITGLAAAMLVPFAHDIAANYLHFAAADIKTFWPQIALAVPVLAMAKFGKGISPASQPESSPSIEFKALQPLTKNPHWRKIRKLLREYFYVQEKKGSQLVGKCRNWAGSFISLRLAKLDYISSAQQKGYALLKTNGWPTRDHSWIEIGIKGDPNIYILDRTIGQFATASYKVVEKAGGFKEFSKVLNPKFIKKHNIRTARDLIVKFKEYDNNKGFYGLKEDYPFIEYLSPSAESEKEDAINDLKTAKSLPAYQSQVILKLHGNTDAPVRSIDELMQEMVPVESGRSILADADKSVIYSYADPCILVLIYDRNSGKTYFAHSNGGLLDNVFQAIDKASVDIKDRANTDVIVCGASLSYQEDLEYNKLILSIRKNVKRRLEEREFTAAQYFYSERSDTPIDFYFDRKIPTVTIKYIPRAMQIDNALPMERFEKKSARSRGAFATLILAGVLTAVSALIILSLPYLMPYLTALAQFGPAAFARDWLYFASDALPDISKMLTYAGLGVLGIARYKAEDKTEDAGIGSEAAVDFMKRFSDNYNAAVEGGDLAPRYGEKRPPFGMHYAVWRSERHKEIIKFPFTYSYSYAWYPYRLIRNRLGGLFAFMSPVLLNEDGVVEPCGITDKDLNTLNVKANALIIEDLTRLDNRIDELLDAASRLDPGGESFDKLVKQAKSLLDQMMVMRIEFLRRGVVDVDVWNDEYLGHFGIREDPVSGSYTVCGRDFSHLRPAELIDERQWEEIQKKANEHLYAELEKRSKKYGTAGIALLLHLFPGGTKDGKHAGQAKLPMYGEFRSLYETGAPLREAMQVWTPGLITDAMGVRKVAASQARPAEDDAIKSRGFVPPQPALIDQRSLTSPLDKMIKEEEAAEVNRVISHLTEKQQILLNYRFVHGMTFRQIGAMFSVTTSEARNLYLKIIKRLKVHFFAKLTPEEREEIVSRDLKKIAAGKSANALKNSNKHSGFAIFALAGVLAAVSALVIFSLPHLMPYLTALAQFGPAAFARDWLYFASGALPDISKMLTLAGFAAVGMILIWKEDGSGKNEMAFVIEEEYANSGILIDDIQKLRKHMPVWFVRNGVDENGQENVGKNIREGLYYVRDPEAGRGLVTLGRYENGNKGQDVSIPVYIGNADRRPFSVVDKIYRPVSRYKKAEKLIDEGEYDEALKLARELSAYNKSRAQRIIDKAHKAREHAERAAIAVRRLHHNVATDVVELLFPEQAYDIVNLRIRTRDLTLEAANIEINSKRLPTPAEAERWLAELAAIEKNAKELLKRYTKDCLRQSVAIIDNSIKFANDELGLQAGTPIDINSIVKDAVTQHGKASGKPDRVILMPLPQKPLRVTADKLSLLSTVINVIENGITAAVKDKDEDAKVEVSVRENAGYAEIIVKDNGGGIAGKLMEAGSVSHRGTLKRRFKFQELGISTTYPPGGVGTTETWYAITDHNGGIDIITSTEDPDKGTTIIIRLPLKGTKIPTAKKEMSFVIGIPENMSKERETAVRKSLGSKVEIVKARDAEVLARMFRDGEKIRGIFIDKAALESGIDVKEITAAMLATTYEGILVMSEIDEETRLEMASLIKEMLPDIETMDAAEIFAFVQKAMKTDPDFGRNMYRLREFTAAHIRNVSASALYNNPDIVRDADVTGKKAGVIITEKMALNNPALAAGVAEIMNAGGIVSFVYGKERNREQAKRFLIESRCRPEDIMNIRLIENTGGLTMEQLEDEVAAKLPEGLGISNVTVVAAPGEISGNVKHMKLLELKEVTINGKKILLAMNTEKVAYRMALMDNLPENSMAIDGIPGLYYNSETRKFTYLPPILPRNVGEEVETYRSAMLLLSSAA